MNMYSTCQSLNCIQVIEKKKTDILTKEKTKEMYVVFSSNYIIFLCFLHLVGQRYFGDAL